MTWISRDHTKRVGAAGSVTLDRDAAVFDTPERAVAPGQAWVFYAGRRVLGGGFICRAG